MGRQRSGGLSFCTGLHRNAQEMEATPLAKGGREEYSGHRLSREVSKTCQHNQKRAQEPQGSCALNFFAYFYGRPSEPATYRRDMPKAEVHIVDGGHFALDTAADPIAQYVREFMK